MSAGRPLLQLAGYSLGLTVCIASSYFVTRHLMQGVSITPQQQVEAGARGPQLRLMANDLAAIGNDFFARAPVDGGATDPAVRTWAIRSLMPQLDALIAATDSCAAHWPECEDLRNAAGRARIMVRNPDNSELRRQAARDMARAIAQAEAYISATGTERFCAEGALPVRFP